PTIVSDRGGLPESVCADDLVVHEYTPEAFIQKIQMVEDDYNRYAREVRENARRKMDTHRERLLDLLADAAQGESDG
ncbi:MAG: hypothetical protein SVU32_00885, partial [Candidatus Nanohaloarchaea archaeon]|nr:hypothetical protein [Candidatus Nanohaloarchaea archaeon]